MPKFNEILLERVNKNENFITEKEKQIITDNLELFTKIYQLGITDCVMSFERSR